VRGRGVAVYQGEREEGREGESPAVQRLQRHLCAISLSHVYTMFPGPQRFIIFKRNSNM
jgi:hypothetical protein